MKIAIETVHTSGLNWTSLTVIVASIIGTVIAASTFITGRVDKSRARTSNEIQSVVKEAVHTLVSRLDSLGGHLKYQDRRLEAVEYTMMKNDKAARSEREDKANGS
jgi:hypothetical protein